MKFGSDPKWVREMSNFGRFVRHQVEARTEPPPATLTCCLTDLINREAIGGCRVTRHEKRRKTPAWAGALGAGFGELRCPVRRRRTCRRRCPLFGRRKLTKGADTAAGRVRAPTRRPRAGAGSRSPPQEPFGAPRAGGGSRALLRTRRRTLG